MTYQDFMRLRMDVSECADFDNYLAEVGGSVPEDVPDDKIVDLLSAIYNTKTIKDIRTITGLTQAAFAQTYRLPKRTVEKWECEGSTPPPYVLEMLLFAVITDLY